MNEGEIRGTISPRGQVNGSIGGGGVSGSLNISSAGDYRLLSHKPSINGEMLIDNYNEIDPTVPEWAKSETKPTYTADEVEAVDRNNETDFAEIDRMFNAVFGTGI